MDDEFHMSISIPSDDEGYILLQCEHCGTFFKATPSDIQDDGVLNIFCPSCGLISENYLTENVIELALKMAKNYAQDAIYDAFKSLERQSKHSMVKFKAGKKPRHESEEPIRSGIEALEVASFLCCNRTAKVKPLLKMTGCYCPFCGVKQYEFE